MKSLIRRGIEKADLLNASPMQRHFDPNASYYFSFLILCSQLMTWKMTFSKNKKLSEYSNVWVYILS